jgi:lysophospholipase L1-like esterase
MALRLVAVYAAIVMATLAGAELLARAYDWVPYSHYLAAGDRVGERRYEFSPGGYGDLVPNQDGLWVIWFHRPYHVQTNSVGLRNAEEPSDKAYRVLAIGDSQTFGPYLSNDDTWPAWAENHLRRQQGHPDGVQVFNAGIAGYTLPDELAYLRDKGVRFKPRLVVLAATERNIYFMRREIARGLQRPHGKKPESWLESGLAGLLRNSALVELAEQVKGRIKIAAAGVKVNRGGDAVTTAPRATPTRADPDEQVMTARFVEVFREAAALLKSHHIRFATVLIPSVDTVTSEKPSDMSAIVERVAQETGTPYLDLTAAFRAHPEAPTSLFLLQRDPQGGGYVGNGHLSREGTAVMGRAVATWLLDQGLVPR